MSPRSAVKPAAVLAVLVSGAMSAPRLAAGEPRDGATPRRASSRAREAIVGGTPAPVGAFASVVEIFDVRAGEVGQCTGTVVAPSLILTAGHCAENVKTGVPNASSGYRVLTAANGGASDERQTSTVSSVIVYEGFRRRVDDADAALLVLSAPTAAPPIGLAGPASGTPRAGSTATMVGWGKSSYSQRHPTQELQSADTVVQGDRWCKHNAPPFYAGGEICTIDPPTYGSGACGGDSGGPLLIQQGSGEQPVEIGIVAHGYGRCSTRLPSVFTRVDRIAAWAHTWMAAYTQSPSQPTT